MAKWWTSLRSRDRDLLLGVVTGTIIAVGISWALNWALPWWAFLALWFLCFALGLKAAQEKRATERTAYRDRDGP